jgi:hypothetical protein
MEQRYVREEGPDSGVNRRIALYPGLSRDGRFLKETSHSIARQTRRGLQSPNDFLALSGCDTALDFGLWIFGFWTFGGITAPPSIHT